MYSVASLRKIPGATTAVPPRGPSSRTRERSIAITAPLPATYDGSRLVCRVLDEAGLPQGLFLNLPGSGSVVGEKRVTDPKIAKVCLPPWTCTS